MIRSATLIGRAPLLAAPLAGLLLCTVAVAGATTRNVPSEFPTIAEALASSTPGDTVVVEVGEHAEPKGVTLPSGVHLLGETTRNEVVVEIPSILVASIDGELPSSIQNIEFRQTGGATTFLTVDGNPLAAVRFNRFHQTTRTRISGGCMFERNEILFPDNTSFAEIGLTGHTSAPPGDLCFRNNVIRYFDGGLIVDGHASIPTVDISKNTFAKSPNPIFPGSVVASFDIRTSHVRLSSNILQGMRYFCVVESGSLTFEYNCFAFFADGNEAFSCSSYVTDPSNIHANPQFCDQNILFEDYRIQSTSPCVGAGEGGTHIGARGVGCESVAVGEGTSPASATLRVFPNPTHGDAIIRLDLAELRGVELRIFDVTGRMHRRIDTGLLGAGAHRIRWDGRGEDGRRLTPGVYYARLGAGRHSASTRIVLAP